MLNNFLSYTGPSIEISDLFNERGRQIEIIVQLSQFIKTERDEESKCRNYPNKEYLNYNDCDQTYIQKIIQEKFNITPFWATQDLDNVTTVRQVYLFLKKWFLNHFQSNRTDPGYEFLDYLFEGSTESPCCIPCVNTKVYLNFSLVPFWS